MPYRAPELFDVKTGKTLDEKVDIWVGTTKRSLLTAVSGLYSLRMRLRPVAVRGRWAIGPNGSSKWAVPSSWRLHR